jgi:hypothetical protein
MRARLVEEPWQLRFNGDPQQGGEARGHPASTRVPSECRQIVPHHDDLLQCRGNGPVPMLVLPNRGVGVPYWLVGRTLSNRGMAYRMGRGGHMDEPECAALAG